MQLDHLLSIESDRDGDGVEGRGRTQQAAVAGAAGQGV